MQLVAANYQSDVLDMTDWFVQWHNQTIQFYNGPFMFL